ncbi:MAG: hypothetical protein V1648_00045 [Candidatus Aenigmatarchaeota archaeon]
MSKHYATADPGMEFSRQNMLFTDLRERGADSFYNSNVPGIYAAFPENNGVVSCIDEGTPHGHIRFAGSGILNENIFDFMQKLRMDDKLACITSHDECGAAGLFAKQHSLKLSEADAYAKEFSRHLAKQLGVSYRHIPMEEMKRPAGLHTARIIYYVGADAFDPLVSGVPNGFVISRAHMDGKNAQKEAGIAAKIAFGGHGFGELFMKSAPLHVVAIGDPRENALSTGSLLEELKPLAAEYKSKVRIDGFTAPF